MQNDISRGNFMRKIDCAHSRSVKTFVWPLKIENTYFYPYKNRYFNSCFYYFWAKKSKINFFSIIFFANQIRWLERSIELSDDGNGFKLDFWRIFEMWEQYTYRLFFGCSHISKIRQKSSLNPFPSPDSSIERSNHRIWLTNKII